MSTTPFQPFLRFGLGLVFAALRAAVLLPILAVVVFHLFFMVLGILRLFDGATVKSLLDTAIHFFVTIPSNGEYALNFEFDQLFSHYLVWSFWLGLFIELIGLVLQRQIVFSPTLRLGSLLVLIAVGTISLGTFYWDSFDTVVFSLFFSVVSQLFAGVPLYVLIGIEQLRRVILTEVIEERE